MRSRFRPRFATAFALLIGVAALRAEKDPLAWVADLRTTDAIHATFVEARQLPIRREPLVLTGEIRFQSQLGLSLHYLTPEERTVIIDASGVALRDDRGRTRRAPARSDAARSAAVLLDVLRFDLAALATKFDLTLPGPAANGTWQLHLTPRPGDTSPGLRSVSITGRDQQLLAIILAPGDPDEINITLGPASRKAAFTPAELERYFR